MMHRFKYYSVVTLMGISLLVLGSCKVLEGTHTEEQFIKTVHDTIPFTLNRSNNICVPVVLNGSDSLNMMFHLGAGSLAMTTEGCLRAPSIIFDDSANIQSWGGKTQSRYSSSNGLEIGSLSWVTQSITEDKHSGPGTDGKFGWNLFKDGVLEVNFDGKFLMYYDDLPKGIDQYEKLDVRIEGSNMFLSVKLQIGLDTIQHEFLMHSGYGASFLLDDELVAKYDIGSKLKIIGQRDLKDSMGNTIRTKKVQVPGMSLGQNVLTDVPAGFFEGAIGRQKMSVMGCDILRRFNFLFDFPAKMIYIKPAESYSLAYSQ